MTEEEKKAIKWLELSLKVNYKELNQLQKDGIVGYGTMEDLKKGEICNKKFILELIEKQQKEIEKYKELLNSNIGVDLSYDDYISKETIREKIEELIPIIKKYEQQRENDEDTDLTYEEVRKYACKVEVYKELLGE